MRMGSSHLHRPKRPRCRSRARLWGLRQEFKLRQRQASLAMSRAYAVRTRITAADHDHALIASVVDLGNRPGVALELAVLPSEVIHSLDHALELSSRDGKFAGLLGSHGQTYGVVAFHK